MSIGRAAVSLAIGFLTGIFLSAFVSMIAESAGAPMRSGWLGLIVLVVMVGAFFHPSSCLERDFTAPSCSLPRGSGSGETPGDQNEG